MSGRRRQTLVDLYEDLVGRHGASLWRFALRLTGDRDEADELLQQTYFEAWKSLHTLREPAAGRAWLSRILQRRFQRWLRQQRAGPRTEREVDEESDASDLLVPDLDALARSEDVQRALDALVPERRLAFLLVFLEGYTCREAAERLGIPLGTVLSRIHRARAELRRHLRSYAGPDAGASRGEERA
jgi:RNA polymerase sigma-70 factor (ECF subfamily)